MSLMEGLDEVRCMYVVVWDPAIVFYAVALPLDEVLDTSPSYSTVADFFDFELLFVSDENRRRRRCCDTTGDRIGFHTCQFDDWEDRVQPA
jgi:hypothetical protein